MQPPKIDNSKLTVDQQAMLENYNLNQKQLTALKDVADMSQEMVQLLDSVVTKDQINKIGTILVDMRETLVSLNDKEAPEQPDTVKPVVKAISDMERALTKAMSAIPAPIVNVPESKITVDATPDLSKLEKLVKTDLPKAFQQAIQSIVIPENDDSVQNQLLEQIAEQLVSIDTGVRLKPQAPTTIGINNDVTTLDKDYATRLDDSATPILYVGKALVGSAEADPVWQIAKLDTSSGLIKTWAGTAGFTQVWDDRTSLTYS